MINETAKRALSAQPGMMPLMRHYFYGWQGGSKMAANLKRSMKPRFFDKMVVTGKDSRGNEIRELRRVQLGVPMSGRERHRMAWSKPRWG